MNCSESTEDDKCTKCDIGYYLKDGLCKADLVVMNSLTTFSNTWQDKGPKNFDITGNGGLTVIAYVKFTGSKVGSWERFFDFGSGNPNGNMLLARGSTNKAVTFQAYNPDSGRVFHFNFPDLNQDTWALYVIRYAAAQKYIRYALKG
eukprot:GDKI01031134.1.p1 GENE.GDKI01031134.1~~GDKI01031134.1.p1  ORF type:complete len:147 (-),score=36.01 GDKI01031134.1:365-805(-)